MSVSLEAWGHKNILGLHSSTLEITRDERLTKRGTCVVGTRATMALADLSDEFKTLAKIAGNKIILSLAVGDLRERIVGYGDPRLTFRHTRDIVVRRSAYICDRTLCVRADKAACDLSREFVGLLRNPDQRMVVSISVERC